MYFNFLQIYNFKIVKLLNCKLIEFLNFNIDAKVEKWYNDNRKQEGAFMLTKDINKMDTKGRLKHDYLYRY